MEKHTTKYLKDYNPPDYWIEKIDLMVDLHEAFTQVTSLMKIRRNNQVADETTPLLMDYDDLTIESVVAEDMVLLPGEYQLNDGYFKLAKVPDAFTLEITSLLKPQENTSMMGLYKSGGTFCTQCEAEGFRKITPYPDRPDVMSRFTCIITADKAKYPVLLSNGNLMGQGELKDGRHYVKWEDPFKKPAYLFALVAGDLVCINDVFTTCSGRRIALKIYVEPENRDKCGHAMASLKQAMKWDEERFGREYDLDLYQIVAVNDFNMGAMENKGLNIFNAKFVLAKPETATDIDFMNIQGVIAHEYFHNWTGNRVTLKNWFQLSLKEGLTVFRDQEFSSDMNSRAVKRISDVKKLRMYQFPEDSGPMAHPVRPEAYIEMNNFYTMTVYDKGAEVIRMLFTLLGRELFRKGMDLFFERFDGQAVTTEDFVRTMEDVSSMDLSQFRLWYSQSGTPDLSLKRRYDPEKKNLSVFLSQHVNPDRNQKDKKPLHIPVVLGLIDKNGIDVTTGNRLVHLTTTEKTVEFFDVEPETLPSVLRGFSAPVKLKTDFSDVDLAFLMGNETDPFNRWDAAQELFFRELAAMISQNEKRRLSGHLRYAFKQALTDPGADKALIARTLTLPDEAEIGEQYETIDIDAIHRARLFLKKALAEDLQDDLMVAIHDCSRTKSHDLSGDAMAKRSLKNLCLSYIGSLGTIDAETVIYDSFKRAGNMTDEFAALTILSDIESDLRPEAMQAFYHKWHDDQLVMDKWFTVQATSILRGTLRRVKALSEHQAFSYTNPNRIRSLINAFAFLNPFHFHDDSGEGYRFIREQILILDKTNPQVAARLASAFNHWKRYDDKRKEMMQKELEAIVGVTSLSNDVYEIVSRALA